MSSRHSPTARLHFPSEPKKPFALPELSGDRSNVTSAWSDIGTVKPSATAVGTGGGALVILIVLWRERPRDYEGEAGISERRQDLHCMLCAIHEIQRLTLMSNSRIRGCLLFWIEREVGQVRH